MQVAIDGHWVISEYENLIYCMPPSELAVHYHAVRRRNAMGSPRPFLSKMSKFMKQECQNLLNVLCEVCPPPFHVRLARPSASMYFFFLNKKRERPTVCDMRTQGNRSPFSLTGASPSVVQCEGCYYSEEEDMLWVCGRRMWQRLAV